MLSDPELSALLDQAGRNLDTLELLARNAQAPYKDPTAIGALRQRVKDLKLAYARETDALTHQVLKRAIERRTGDRRRGDRRRGGRGEN
jgi:hypothetical protein